MFKKIFINGLLAYMLLLSITMSTVVSVSAQAPAPTPVPTPTQQPVVIQSSNPNGVAFSTIGQNEIQLTGPLDATSFSFALPADWKLTSGAMLNLAMAVSFTTIGQVTSTTSTPVASTTFTTGGTITISFNNVLLGVVQLNQLGEVQRTLPIPENALSTASSSGRMSLSFVLDSRYACDVHQQVLVSIHTTSQFILPHNSVALPVSLAGFPQPIYQGSFIPDSAVVVIPDQPSAMDLQEAMTVAAGFGNLSYNNLALDMTTVGQLTPNQKNSNHIILVGKATSLPILQQMQLPIAINASQEQSAGGSPDDGLIEMINSPWSSNHVILLVSGITDAGVLKAAQAVTTGTLLSNRFPNVSVIQNILSTPVASPQPVDQTLAQMGYSRRVFSNLGVDSASYRFYIPPGWTVAPDARFDLVFGNSELLDYNRSGIVVEINNAPIGSVRLSDITAAQATNKVGISIPASVVLPGYNTLTVRVNLVPIDDCTPSNLQGLWIQDWPESNLHLPLIQATVNPVSSLDLSSYPAPFTYDPLLKNTAFVLPHNDLNAWRSALKIAAYLGQSTNGTLSALSVYYNDQIPAADKAKYNLFVIGLPSQSPLLKEMNSSLPVPFSSGDNLSPVNSSQVAYHISPDSPLGYIEMMPSPWNPNLIVLAALGNTANGVNWATTALIDPSLRNNLAGNFDIIHDRQILTNDTRVSPINSAATVPTLQAGVVALAPSSGSSTIPSSHPAWIPLAIIVAFALIVVILAAVAIRNQWRIRMRKLRKK